MEGFFKGINPFDFIDESQNIDKQYVEEVLREVFTENKMTLSVISNKWEKCRPKIGEKGLIWLTKH